MKMEEDAHKHIRTIHCSVPFDHDCSGEEDQDIDKDCDIDEDKFSSIHMIQAVEMLGAAMNQLKHIPNDDDILHNTHFIHQHHRKDMDAGAIQPIHHGHLLSKQAIKEILPTSASCEERKCEVKDKVLVMPALLNIARCRRRHVALRMLLSHPSR